MITTQNLAIEAFENYLTSSRSSTGEPSTKEKKFYVSDMGKCLRMRYLKRKGIKGEYGFEAYFTFAMGDFVHDLGYKAFEARGVLYKLEQSVENEHFTGRYDGKIINDGAITMFDFKSTNPYVMKRICAGAGDNPENIMQVLTYLMLDPEADKMTKDALVIYVNKLPSDKIEPTIIKPMLYHFEIYKDRIKEDMDKIIDYWNRDKIPPCTCPSWSMQKYNSFFPFCKGDEKMIKKHLSYLKAGKLVTANGYEITVTDPIKE